MKKRDVATLLLEANYCDGEARVAGRALTFQCPLLLVDVADYARCCASSRDDDRCLEVEDRHTEMMRYRRNRGCPWSRLPLMWKGGLVQEEGDEAEGGTDA